MATVTCKYCKAKFNREKEAFVQIPPKTGGIRFSYAHGECYQKAVADGIEQKTGLKVWDPDKSTTCFWCHAAIQTDDKDIIPMPQLPNRYVHKKCNEVHPQDDKEKLMLYIIKLFKLKEDYILPKYMKQINSYAKDYNFSYSGMLKALKYWYEVKQHPVDLSRGVGIIITAYKPAYDYYYALYLSQQENEKKDFNKYIPQDINIKIVPPERQIPKRKLFTFLDKDEINDE